MPGRAAPGGEPRRRRLADAAQPAARLPGFAELVPIERGVSRQAALLIGEETERLPGVVVEVEPVRQYLNERGEVDGRLLSHVLGYVGPVNLQEFRELEDDGYLRDDLIGRAGIEATFEGAARRPTAPS